MLNYDTLKDFVNKADKRTTIVETEVACEIMACLFDNDNDLGLKEALKIAASCVSKNYFLTTLNKNFVYEGLDRALQQHQLVYPTWLFWVIANLYDRPLFALYSEMPDTRSDQDSIDQVYIQIILDIVEYARHSEILGGLLNAS